MEHREIERKFLVSGSSYRQLATRTMHIRQAYIGHAVEGEARVSIRDDKAWIIIKSAKSQLSRFEYEIPISVEDAEDIIANAGGNVISKTRYIVPIDEEVYAEVDEFQGNLSGLVIAEVELPYESYEFEAPAFFGREVTGVSTYYNHNLAKI